MWTLSVELAWGRVWSVRLSLCLCDDSRCNLAPHPQPLQPSSQGPRWQMGVPGDSRVQPPPHAHETVRPQRGGASSALAPPTAAIPPSQWPLGSCSPPPPHQLTLQFLVPGSPIQVDGSRPVVDEALEASILSLLHSAAGRVDRDDRAPEACGVRQAGGWARAGQLGWAPLPQLHSLPLGPGPRHLPHSR